ncbi:N-acetyl sugar amidotransferase [Leptospira levettii]|uniref:N-acetyl sugar amidotransferase n=1 Tax=Leptospira levettii TaxID=2023178 RepID=UPI0010834310|nr:N-acetyl sugar amidotransferase [Leptospira levettii]TGM35487.1 N-acetyl sugar amidotransferase [Leptospira levettii]
MKYYLSEFKICKRCLYTTYHPLGLVIDENGICSGCKIHEEKDQIDWELKKQKLEMLVQDYRSKSGKNYDCIVPVTGAQDSYYILHLVKNVLKLNPLCVSYNKYYNTEVGIRNLANLRIKFNVDIFIQNVNPNSVKKITRHTLAQYGSMYWHCLAGQTVFPVQTSVKYKIPLIIWGAHQGMEQVGMFSHDHEVEMTRRYRKDHDLFGVEAEDLCDHSGSLAEEDVWQYLYPTDFDLHVTGTRGIYLGNFFRWDPMAQHEEMIKLYNYKSAILNRTPDMYDYIDCFNYSNLHDWIKLKKTGYSKVTDHVTREIRHKRLTRKQAISIVKHFEFKEPIYQKEFLDWLDLDLRSFQFMIEQHQDPFFWTETEYRSYDFVGPSTYFEENSEGKNEWIWPSTSNDYKKENNQYVTIGKGYPDL